MGSLPLLLPLSPSPPRLPAAFATAAAPGRLYRQVTVISGCNLSAVPSLYQRVDPYVCLSLGASEHRLPPVRDTRHPAWDDLVTFPLDPSGHDLQVSVWDAAQGDGAACLGRVSLDVTSPETVPVWEGWFTLQGPEPQSAAKDAAEAPLNASEGAPAARRNVPGAIFLRWRFRDDAPLQVLPGPGRVRDACRA